MLVVVVGYMKVEKGCIVFGVSFVWVWGMEHLVSGNCILVVEVDMSSVVLVEVVLLLLL